MSLAPVYDQITNSDPRHASAVASRSVLPVVTAETDSSRTTLASHARLAAILVKILRSAAEAIYHDRDVARVYIDRSLALLEANQDWDKIGHEHAAATLVRGGLAPWQIVRVLAHIDAHLDSPIRTSDLAEIARLSTGHFSRSFTRSVGVTPFAYIAGRRLARAQNMMLTTDEPLAQIALACGLCDQSHLTRLFHRFLGTNPSTWRRHYQSEPIMRVIAQSAPTSKLADAPYETEVRCCRTTQRGAKPENLTC